MPHQSKIITGIVGDVTLFKSVTDGKFSILIDNDENDIEGLNFLGKSGYNDIALVIQTAIRAKGDPGFLNAVVSASADTGNDVTFTFISGTSDFHSLIYPLYPSGATLGTEISGTAFLNGQMADMFLSLDITLVDEADMESIRTNNASHNDTLSVMDFYNLNMQSKTGKCIEMDVVKMPQYIDWYNALDAIQPFANRTITYILIDND